MSPAAWGAVATIASALLLAFTAYKARQQQARADQTTQMTATVTNALSTTEIMRSLIAPMEHELGELRKELAEQTAKLVTQSAQLEAQSFEIGTLRTHIMGLEEMLRSAGIDPPPILGMTD